MVTGPAGAHALHSRQCLTIQGISSKISDDIPAARRMVVMGLTPACHQRRCSFLNSLSITACVPLLSARREEHTSKRVQSFGVGIPVDASRNVRRAIGSSDGPRLPGLRGPSEFPSEASGAADEDEDDCPSPAAATGGGDSIIGRVSSPSPRSVPSGSCAWLSEAGTDEGAAAGILGCAPFLFVLPIAAENLHSPGRYVCL